MATTSGVLTEKVSSTVSSPAVHYSAAYSAERAGDSDEKAAVRLTFGAWLNSDSAALGTGVQLTVFARIDSGVWQSVVLKNRASVWKGTDRHTVSLTLTVNATGDAAAVEWFVSRDGSVSSGTAGVLGSRMQPMRYGVSLPAYAAAQAGSASNGASTGTATDTAGNGLVYWRGGGVWKSAVPYVKVGGVWKTAVPYVRSGGVWMRSC